MSKPRIKIYDRDIPSIRFICTGYKDGIFHCRFGETEQQAYSEWIESDPTPPAELDGNHWTDLF